MLCKCHWIVLYTVHFTAFCLGGGAFFPGHGVYSLLVVVGYSKRYNLCYLILPDDDVSVLFDCHHGCHEVGTLRSWHISNSSVSLRIGRSSHSEWMVGLWSVDTMMMDW